MNSHREKLLEINHIKKHFELDRNMELKDENGMNFDIYRGETLGLDGESGCGKSTAGRTIMRLYEASDGEVHFAGENVHSKKSSKKLKEFNRSMQMIFQDP